MSPTGDLDYRSTDPERYRIIVPTSKPSNDQSKSDQ